MRGEVKFFLTAQNYGYITGEDGKDYFVHANHILDSGTLNQGEKVLFDEGRNNKGVCAVNILRTQRIVAVRKISEARKKGVKEGDLLDYLIERAEEGGIKAGVLNICMEILEEEAVEA
tara:strand:+ start:1034 stop:1387 length:354 start_codon:yes stop_codon:yes gene_type:complete